MGGAQESMRRIVSFDGEVEVLTIVVVERDFWCAVGGTRDGVEVSGPMAGLWWVETGRC